MPLLKNGQPIEDSWVELADDAALPAAGAVIVSFERWQRERATLIARGAPLGVRLKNTTTPAELADDLPQLQLVAVELPKFRDGRAFTQARALRERHGFAGEIRALGHIIPDQYLFLTRIGVDTVVVPEARLTEAWQQALREFSVAYQPALTPDQPFSLMRRHLAVPA